MVFGQDHAGSQWELISDRSIDAVASAIFDRRAYQVVEAYSDYDREPREFTDAAQVAHYMRERLESKDNLAYLFVVYKDMEGHAIKELIHLDAKRVPGHRVRYTWSGWGMISVQISSRSGRNGGSSIASNSEKRAMAWAPTSPDLPPPSTWNWKAVASHTRRLKRILANCSN
jgi:hypothetical protein